MILFSDINWTMVLGQNSDIKYGGTYVASRLLGTKPLPETMTIEHLGTNFIEIKKLKSFFFVQENIFENVNSDLAAILFRPQFANFNVQFAHCGRYEATDNQQW